MILTPSQQSFLLLLSAVYLAEKRHIPMLFGFQILALSVLDEGYSRNVSCRTKFDIYVFMLVFSLTRPGLETTIYRTRGEHTNYYTSDLCNKRTWTRFLIRLHKLKSFCNTLGGCRGRMVVGLLLEIEIIQITRNLNLVGNSGAETTYPSAAPEFTPVFLWGTCSFLCSVL